jgi:hypothetical protein
MAFSIKESIGEMGNDKELDANKQNVSQGSPRKTLMSILKAGAEVWYERTELRVINEGTGWINVAIKPKWLREIPSC